MSPRKRNRSKTYSSKFFGITRYALDRLKQDIPNGEERTRAGWLLINMLLVGNWDYYNPSKPFKCSQRLLRIQLNWSYKTIRRYRDILITLGVLTITYPGGLYGKSHLYKLDIKYMGINK